MYKVEVLGQVGIRARIVADSINKQGNRITTFELKYPRFIHSELMTHRMFSRNASSSRAIPVKTFLKQIREEPARPISWGLNQAGMQASKDWTFDEDTFGDWTPLKEWELAARNASEHAKNLADENIHKQVSNRLLEPFQFMNTVVTATEYDNWFYLRDHKDAQPEIRELAIIMRECMDQSIAELLSPYEWHLPYVLKDEGLSDDVALKCSSARCARVSYLNHDKSIPSVEKDIELYNMLAVRPYDDGKGHVLADNDPIHLSPLEHQAKPMSITMGCVDWDEGTTSMDVRNDKLWSGNFCGFIQYRQLL